MDYDYYDDYYRDFDDYEDEQDVTVTNEDDCEEAFHEFVHAVASEIMYDPETIFKDNDMEGWELEDYQISGGLDAIITFYLKDPDGNEYQSTYEMEADDYNLVGENWVDPDEEVGEHGGYYETVYYDYSEEDLKNEIENCIYDLIHGITSDKIN